MRNVLWFLLGVIGGFVAAHVMNKDPRGHEVSPTSTPASRSSPTASATRTASRKPRMSALVDSAKASASATRSMPPRSGIRRDRLRRGRTPTAAIDSADDAAKKLTD